MKEAPIHQSHVFSQIKISRTIFEKGHPMNIPVKLFQIRTSGSRGDFLKNCLKNSISLIWQPEFLMESNSVNNFWRGPPKEHSCQVWSELAKWFGRRRCLKKLLMTHNGHIITLKAPLEHVVLRWAKKRLFQISRANSFRTQTAIKFQDPGEHLDIMEIHCGKFQKIPIETVGVAHTRNC